MRVTSTGSSAYVQEQKRAYAETGSFAEMYAELKLARETGNQLKLDTPLVASNEPDTWAAENPATYELGENGLPVGMAKWEDMGNYDPSVPWWKYTITPPTCPESIYELPASEWATQSKWAMLECSEIDTTGMTKGEIYNAVKSVFEDYLGEDFMQPCFTYIGYGQEKVGGVCAATTVYVRFVDALRDLGIEYEDKSAALEASEYAGMEKSEIKTAVRAKYPEIMTLGECLSMGWELYELGVTTQNYGFFFHLPIYHAITGGNGNLYTDQHQAILDTLLDYPADFDKMTSQFDFLQDSTGNYSNYRNFQNQLKTLDPLTSILATFQVSDSSLYTDEMLTALQHML